jgi:rhodanese-related sulfurtransferase
VAQKITAAELAKWQSQVAVQLIDICSPTEYAAGHVPGAINIPMEQIESRIADLSPRSPVVLICKSGQRAAATAKLVESRRQDVLVLDGGTRAWGATGAPVVASTRTRWSLERQVRLGAGLLVLFGVVLSLFRDRAWIALSAFVGLGLTFAGLTDICGMAFLLAKMPWNKARIDSPTDVAKDHSCAV